MKWPEDVIEDYSGKLSSVGDHVKDVKKLTREDLEKIGIMMIHRRKIVHWISINH